MTIETPPTGSSEKIKNSDSELFLKTLGVLTKENPECAQAFLLLSNEEKSEIENHLNMLGYSWTIFNVVDSSSSSYIIEKIKEFKSTQDKNSRKKIISEITDFLG